MASALLSKYHKDHPLFSNLEGQSHCIDYQPGETRLSPNRWWKFQLAGPIWFPLNYLIIEALQKYHYYYGDT